MLDHAHTGLPLGRVLMVQGTTSDAGKSTLVAALCRVFARAGYRVAPFKAQNMSNNAAVVDGGEIGRAQAVQARAAGVRPTVDMNPVLLKPQSDETSQVVLLGRPLRTEHARDYYARKLELWPAVTGALDRLRATHDIVVIEGAGSPAEINLAPYDIVNMRVAMYAGAPVLLVGDIERGGVFAALFGTVALLSPPEQALIRGFVINKFRGDPSLLTPGFAMLEARTGIPTLGVLPYLDLARMPAEDGLALDAHGRIVGAPTPADDAPAIDVAVLRLPRIANLDEFQPLACEPDVRLRFVRTPDALGTPDLIIVPGTKATIADLAWVRTQGLDRALQAARDRGTPVLGICGGYQMLGEQITDPVGVEGPAGEVAGLGLLPVATTFAADKVTVRVRARIAAATALWGALPLVSPAGIRRAGADAATSYDAYEIHMGRTVPTGPLGGTPFAVDAGDAVDAVDAYASSTSDGASSVDGRVVGSYLHGLFEHPAFRRAIVRTLAARAGITLPDADTRRANAHAAGGHLPHERMLDRALDDLADAVHAHVDLGAIATMLDVPPLAGAPDAGGAAAARA